MTLTTEYLLGFSAGTSACMYIYRQVSGIVKESHGSKNGNGASGQKPVSYWEAKFDKLDGHAERQTKILEQQTALLQNQAQSLTRLVTIAEMKSGIL